MCNLAYQVRITPIEGKPKTNHEVKFPINKIFRDKIREISIKKNLNKQIAIKRMRTKFDIKIKWNQILRGKIKIKNQLRKGFETKQIAIKRMRTKFHIKIK